jgi:hypothetical protein
MNANEISPKTKNVRLNRIRNASFLFRILVYVSLAFQIYLLLAYFFGWPPPFHDKLRIAISPSHIYTSPSEMPPEILALWLVREGLAICGLAVLSCLFWLYEQGILFAAKNVNYIRFFGYVLILEWVVDYQLSGVVHDLNLSTVPILAGLLIIFVAWIMDEGRKIQEEQALTV